MEYLPTFVDQLDEDYISHHGIKGMKWGVRRYENYDGTLTSVGKKRYDKYDDSSNSKSKSSSDKVKQIAKKAAKGAAIAGGAALAGYALYKGAQAGHDRKLRKEARRIANEAMEENPYLRNMKSDRGRKNMRDQLARENYESMVGAEQKNKRIREVRRDEHAKAHLGDMKSRIKGGTPTEVEKLKTDEFWGRNKRVEAVKRDDQFVSDNIGHYKKEMRYHSSSKGYTDAKRADQARRRAEHDRKHKDWRDMTDAEKKAEQKRVDDRYTRMAENMAKKGAKGYGNMTPEELEAEMRKSRGKEKYVYVEGRMA